MEPLGTRRKNIKGGIKGRLQWIKWRLVSENRKDWRKNVRTVQPRRKKSLEGFAGSVVRRGWMPVGGKDGMKDKAKGKNRRN